MKGRSGAGSRRQADTELTIRRWFRRPVRCNVRLMSEPVARTPEEWFAILRGEVNELGNALGEAIRTLSGDELFAHEEEVRALTKEARRGGAERGRSGGRSSGRALARARRRPLARGRGGAGACLLHLSAPGEHRRGAPPHAGERLAGRRQRRRDAAAGVAAGAGWLAEGTGLELSRSGQPPRVAAPAPDVHRPPDGDAPLDRARPPGRHRLGARQPSRRRPRRARKPRGAGGAPLGDVGAAQRATQRRGRSAGRPGLPPDGPLVGGPAVGRRDRAGGRGALRRTADAAAARGVPQLDRRRSRRKPQGASPRDRVGAAVRPFRGLTALRERARSPGARPLPLRSAREAARDAAPRDRRRAVGAGDSAHPSERAVSLPLPRDGPEAARAAGQRRSARSTTRRAICSAI